MTNKLSFKNPPISTYLTIENTATKDYSSVAENVCKSPKQWTTPHFEQKNSTSFFFFYISKLFKFLISRSNKAKKTTAILQRLLFYKKKGKFFPYCHCIIHLKVRHPCLDGFLCVDTIEKKEIK